MNPWRQPFPPPSLPPPPPPTTTLTLTLPSTAAPAATTMVDNNCIIEGNVKFRDGKKVRISIISACSEMQNKQQQPRRPMRARWHAITKHKIGTPCHYLYSRGIRKRVQSSGLVFNWTTAKGTRRRTTPKRKTAVAAASVKANISVFDLCTLSSFFRAARTRHRTLSPPPPASSLGNLLRRGAASRGCSGVPAFPAAV